MATELTTNEAKEFARRLAEGESPETILNELEAIRAQKEAGTPEIQTAFDTLFAVAKKGGVSKNGNVKYTVTDGKYWAMLIKKA